MAKEESFMLVSLEESKAKKLAQVISNDTSRKILDLLAKKDATETEISNQLNIPISTVHYNLKALMEANLILVEEYHYSEKGKEVNHYKLANKLIIIAPKENPSLKDALKKFLPITLISIGVAAIIHIIHSFTKATANFGARSIDFAQKVSHEPLLLAQESAEALPQAGPTGGGMPFAFWFLLGALFAVVLYIVFDAVSKKRNKKSLP